MAWVKPTTYTDVDSIWTDESKIYDDNTGTYAYSVIISPNYNTCNLDLTRAAINCNKIRFYAKRTSNFNHVIISVYYNSQWILIYDGDYTNQTWVEKNLDGIHSVIGMRFCFHNEGSSNEICYFYEAEFYEINIPTVTTQAVTNILSTTATGNGNITATGGENCTKRGICYNLTGNPTVADSKVEETGSFGTGAFTESLINLSPGTTYHVKAYAYNSAGYGYSSEADFTTNKVAPTVTTQIPTDVLQTTVTANGTMVASGGENATIEGFKYDTTQNEVDPLDAHNDGSFAVGTFTKAITGLTANTSYWIRVYATNSIGTSYGAWVQFQTAAVGIIPTGTKIDLCADYLGYTYHLQKSETDDGLPYSAYFVINTDLTSDKTGLTYYKRILDLDLYFRCESSGTAEIYVKRDSEATWQYLGSVGLTDVTAPTIIIKHLAIDTKAKDFDFKISYGNACRFLGLIFQFLPGGER